LAFLYVNLVLICLSVACYCFKGADRLADGAFAAVRLVNFNRNGAGLAHSTKPQSILTFVHAQSRKGSKGNAQIYYFWIQRCLLLMKRDDPLSQNEWEKKGVS